MPQVLEQTAKAVPHQVVIVDDIDQEMGLGGLSLGLQDDALGLPEDAVGGAPRVEGLLRLGRVGGGLEVALQELIAANPPPEVVIVDYNMPGMNGAQLIGGYSTAVAKDRRFDNTSILLMSGLPPSHFQDFMSEFSQLKLGILEKPFSLETLRRKLANIQGTRKLSGSLGEIPNEGTDALAHSKN